MNKTLLPTSLHKNIRRRGASISHLPIMMIVGVLCTFVLTLGGFITQAPTVYADSRPGGNVADPVVRAVDIAEPSVVRIITTLNSHLIVHFAQGQDVTFPTPTSSNNSNSNSNNGAYPLQLSGSGTFITSKGDILTADHVVNPPKDQSLLQFLDQQAAPDVAAYINQNAKSGTTQMTADQVAQQLDSGQLKSTPTFDTPTSEVFLSTNYTGPLSAANFSAIPADIHATVDKIEKESAVDQKDVAIIHAPFNFDTPSVTLDDSSNVQQQDALTIIGFPGNGDVSTRPGDLLTSSVNKITVSSIKTTNNGAQVIQVGGNVEHGDSGGPALDSNGNVVGIVSFGLSSAGSPGGTSFLQASNSARDLVQALNLDTTPGTFQKVWSSAFADYASTTPGHWHKAQQEFQQLATNYQQFKAVDPYLTYTTTQAKTEVTTTPKPKSTPTPSTSTSTKGLPVSVPTLLLTGGIVVVIVLLAALLFGVAIRGRKKTQQAAASGHPASNVSTVQPQAQVQSAAKVEAHDDDDGMTAFGAPPKPANTLPRPVQPVRPAPTPTPASPTLPPVSTPSGTFTTVRIWPCGHPNRSNARFCSVCGEPAPVRRQVEQ